MLNKFHSQLHNHMRFFSAFLKYPRIIGSVAPSSSFLTNEMFKFVNWHKTNTIVELGAGTGVFTERINTCKSSQCTAMIFEFDNHLRGNLQDRFKELFFYSNAKLLMTTLKQNNISSVDVIISGLPFTNFSNQETSEILYNVHQTLRSGGLFVAFQYYPTIYTQLNQVFNQVTMSHIKLNFPPAFVYTCYK
ncbi:phospholipid methyltransferase [Hazenella sp. IB182357]|uniref:Phospholipid methyltransferase n=1 Tax=Polycladospora coralii TaxID=2771432 RepID=A0A926N9A5_9BACL|nr:rRNA adenine N-6-methyltransferase family protein [Polycladospora coralii]MBD1372098.1 phospholipid methyltransferase [Polycladospora coralii]MBS7530604.1 phospholipid methyltransferase [Polycladospora coralii]